MGGSRGSGSGRAAAFAVVAAGHAGALFILVITLDTRIRPRLAAGAVSTWILLPASPRTRERRPERNIEPAPIEPLALPPIPLPDIRLQGDAPGSIDWLAEAARAAEDTTAAPHTRAFGKIPEGPSWLGSPRHAPAHKAGDQYRLDTGESIVWVSDRCYIVSEPAPLGTPDVFARSQGTKVACQAPPGPPPGQLFKDLPAYKRYHPQ
ncbi:MAG: hypothetical protein WA747_10600 [Steroidobacteraceae bacterium]